MKYNLSDNEIQEVINTVSGKTKKDITWDEFNSYLTAKV
jgi:Ca2+-binding EF-hand superfamily protein